MSRASESVKLWRVNTKARMVEAMGGQCSICDYKDCADALEFHHLDPTQKDLTFGAIRGSPVSWARIIVELRKCILLCCRCHREFHAGFRTIPDTFPQFNENYADYQTVRNKEKQTPCLVCGKDKPMRNKTCSLSCAAKLARKIDWDVINLPALLQSKTITEIAEELNVSWQAVKKRIKKMAPNPGTPANLV